MVNPQNFIDEVISDIFRKYKINMLWKNNNYYYLFTQNKKLC